MKPIRYIIPAVLSLAISSCIEPLTLDVDEPLPPVVRCILNESNVQNLEIYGCTKKDDRSYVPVTRAEAWLEWGGERVADFQPDGEGRWRADFRPTEAQRYTLKIVMDGKDTLSASTTFPPEVEFENMLKNVPYEDPQSGKMTNYATNCFEFHEYDRDWRHKDVFGYLCKMPLNLWIYPIVKVNHWPESVVYGKYIITDHKNASGETRSPLKVTDLHCYSEDNLQTLQYRTRLETEWIDKFYPNALVYEGYVHIRQPEIYYNGYTEHKLTTKNSFILAADYENWYMGGTGGYFQAIIASEEYDLYLQDVHKVLKGRDSDITLIYNSENIYSNVDIYSNIRGGMGIFGAQIVRYSKGRRSMTGYPYVEYD